jgi:tRNA pseudouridine38-40 synthase
MARYKLTIEYDGTNYHGWQRQDNLATVQEEMEKSIHRFCGQELVLYCSGRTDAGVHALGQVAHVDLPGHYEDFKVRDGINFYLKPQPIAVLNAELVADDFHARFSTTERSYIYRIVNRYAPLTVEKDRAWQIPRPLDFEAMRDAASVLVGHHDFTTFRDTECQAKSPFKTLDQLDVRRLDNDVIEIFARSRSFLHHQVRNMVGSLKIVGDGRWTKTDLEDALHAKDRRRGGPTAPPGGLYLYKIAY